eukprot:6201755-Pleurochrysis_carterae.AAC.1
MAEALACVGVFRHAKLKLSIVKSFGKRTKAVNRQVVNHSKDKRSINCTRGEHSRIERDICVSLGGLNSRRRSQQAAHLLRKRARGGSREP